MSQVVSRIKDIALACVIGVGLAFALVAALLES